MKKITFILSFLLNIIVNPIWSQECSIVTITSPTPTQVSVVSAYDWTEVINTQGDSFTFCLPDGCFYLYTYSDNITWNFNDLTLLFETNNINIQWQYTDSTGYGIAYFEFNTISGCLDPNACNFNPNANCYDYNLCDYSCFGCTDTLASNYSSEATIDNNTCCYNQWVTITVSDSAYFSITNSLGNYILSTDNYYNNLNSGFCFNPGCYNLYVQGIDEDPYSI